ncbi:MAG TPA: cation:proton antiporter [Burkholderiales bacterium]|jgi:Kef-type K+ transport system membrane component KefB|nr:cation:proton antiporter [Burkholderiales bacterium]
MTEGGFLPEFPFVAGELALLGAVLLSALAAGHACVRYLRLPRITGFVAAGLLLGPSVLDVLDAQVLHGVRIFVDISLGLILFELGRRLDLGWLKRDRWLAAAALAESALSFVLVLAVLRAFRIEPVYAATAAAVVMVTSPAVIILVVHDERAQGPLTERLLTLTALNNVVAFLLITVLFGFIHAQYAANWINAVAHPLYLLAGSLLGGYAAHRTLIVLARWLPKRDDVQFVLLVGAVVALVGAANALKLSVLVSLLAFGVFTRNLDRNRHVLAVEFGPGGQLFFVVLFVLTGAGIELQELLAGGLVGLAVVAARFAGKLTGVALFAPLSGLKLSRAAWLAVGMMPISGVALVMLQGAGSLYPEFGAKLAATVAAALVLLEIVGPLATQWALRRAGETAPENAR